MPKNIFPSSAVDLHTGRTVRVCKAEDVGRTAFPVTLQQFREDGSWWGPMSVGNTSDAWTCIADLANKGRISQTEAEALRQDADKAAEKLKHVGNGKWIAA